MNSVVVKGSEEKIKEVSIVKALINISDLSTELKTGPNKIQNVPLVAYDKNGEILDVELVPSKVKAKLNLGYSQVCYRGRGSVQKNLLAFSGATEYSGVEYFIQNWKCLWK